MAPEEVKVYNPAFDVTEADRIDAIVTERGVLRPPYGPSIARLFSREGGKAL
jgi:methylthioribose-1-phosphate isomerase